MYLGGWTRRCHRQKGVTARMRLAELEADKQVQPMRMEVRNGPRELIRSGGGGESKEEVKGFGTCLSSQLELGFRRSTDLEPPGA